MLSQSAASISLDTSHQRFTVDLTADFISLTIRKLRPSDAGHYTVSLEGGAGMGVSEVSTLLVILSPPMVTITMSPSSPVIESSKVVVMVIIIIITILINAVRSWPTFIVYFLTEGAHSAKNMFHN